MNLFESEKRDLIRSLRWKGITDEKVLDAFYKVSREKFIPESLRKFAYEDNALPIACMQTISQPFTVAYMTMILEVNKNDKVLEVGTGSGYQTAILCELSDNVYTIERIESLYKSAKELLEKLNYKFHINLGDGSLGWEENAPFDRIIVTAGSPSIPQSLIEQLKKGGKLVIPVGSLENQKLYALTRINDEVEYKIHENFKFVPLIGEGGWNRND